MYYNNYNYYNIIVVNEKWFYNILLPINVTPFEVYKTQCYYYKI